MDWLKEIPSDVERISFLDSDYGYEADYLPILKTWLQKNKAAMLNVFAYNDSVALRNVKRFVSDTGGTCYRIFLLLREFFVYFSFLGLIPLLFHHKFCLFSLHVHFLLAIFGTFQLGNGQSWSF